MDTTENLSRTCWLCGEAVQLEYCKVDEQGLAVHDDCYMARVSLQNTWYLLCPTRRWALPAGPLPSRISQ